MSDLYALGIDVGGSSTKTTIHSLDGTLRGVGKAGYKPAQPGPGIVEYDPSDILDAVERSIADAVRAAHVSPSQIVAITTDAMVSGAVGIGHDGRPTTAYTTTLDTRFNADLERMIRDHEAAIRRSVGSSSPVVAAKAAWYRRTQPDVFRRTRVFVTAGGLVGAHLAGLEPGEEFIEPTVLWAVGLSDTRRGAWNPELLDALDVPSSLVPRIVPSTHAVGGLAPHVARRVGLDSGIPIIAGMGDQMAGFLGAGVLAGNRGGDSAGTYSVVGHRVEDFAPDAAGLFDVVPSPTGSGFVEQAVVVIGGGFTRQWFDSKIATDSSSGEILDVDKIAGAVAPGSDGVVFIPHLGGQSSPGRPWLNGGWLGLNWTHDKGHLARSLMEAMAYEVGIALSAMDVDDEVTVFGYGGGTSSPVANQIKADVLGLDYVSLGDIAPASLAAALLGAHATGHLDDLDSVLQAVSAPERTYRPDPASVESYRALRDDYRSAVEVTARFRHDAPSA